jgi:hypothetical protein
MAASIISGGAKPNVNAISRSGETGVSAVEGMKRNIYEIVVTSQLSHRTSSATRFLRVHRFISPPPVFTGS